MVRQASPPPAVATAPPRPEVRQMRTVRVVIALIGIACFVLAAMSVAVAQQNAFSLAPRQSVAVGQYTIRYLGLTSGGWPAYELYVQGGGRLAAFPSSPPPAACCEYLYRNVSITTTAIAPGGATVAGVVTVR
ncbi:MAG: hypothetical protein DMF95_32410 [Acidobacteria bacterium]|nr:MAG: hypothetical protein DMF95_32410 [Acidobacteriota bacterium]